MDLSKKYYVPTYTLDSTYYYTYEVFIDSVSHCHSHSGLIKMPTLRTAAVYNFVIISIIIRITYAKLLYLYFVLQKEDNVSFNFFGWLILFQKTININI